MTRRPPMPPDGNIRRAHQRMAPGGRLWSESPVKGPAVRVVAAGAEEEDPCWYFTDDFTTNDPDPGNWAAVSTELLETSSFYISVKLADGPDPGTVWINLYTQDVAGPYWVEASGPDDDGWYEGFYGQPWGASYADVATYDIDGPTYGDAYTQTAVRICPGGPPE